MLRALRGMRPSARCLSRLRTFSRAGLRMALAASLLWGMGAQWACLQTFAWAAMALRASPRQGLVPAVAGALSGGRPCRLCLAARRGARSQKAQDQRTADPQPETLFHAGAVLPAALRPLWLLPARPLSPDEPPLPVPARPPSALPA